jgi:hypothetical protein
MRATLSILLALIAAAFALAGESRVDSALFAAAQKAMPREVATNLLARALESGLWNSNRTAVAVSIAQPHPKSSLVFVFLRQKDGTYLAVDARGVEGGNLGKIGSARRPGYDRFETTPTEWLHREDGRFMVEMRTRGWRGGQRYTASEPLLISTNGTVLWR